MPEILRSGAAPGGKHVTTGLRGDLGGKIIVVTGGTQGVGGAAARRAAEWGAAGLLVVGRDADKGAQAVADLEKLGTRALFVGADLADAEAPGRIIGTCENAFGRIDGLVNAAAWTDRAGLLDASVEFLDRMYATNLRAPFLLMQGAANLMKRGRIAGAIVNVLSVNAYCGAPNLAAYSATKGGLATLTRNAANALAPDHIRVNGIMLGWVDTPAEHAVQQRESPDGKDWLAKASAKMPFGRLIDPEELADCVAFLLSRHAGVMTGALIDYNQTVLGAH
jgi:NAD(P)-dependent dehydrogenase (short-subunit alcohol dehydrogenase family)